MYQFAKTSHIALLSVFWIALALQSCQTSTQKESNSQQEAVATPTEKQLETQELAADTQQHKVATPEQTNKSVTPPAQPEKTTPAPPSQDDKNRKKAASSPTVPAIKEVKTVKTDRSVRPPANTPNIRASKDYLLGKIDYKTHPDFVEVDKKHTSKPPGEVYLRKEAYEAFVQMFEAAKADGIKLSILSAARNFDKQKAIWNGKWNGSYAKIKDEEKRTLAILKFSAMPCTSRHHWGTDIDLNDLSNSTFEKGEGKKVYEWLVAHAPEYGFCNVYSAKDDKRPEGYEQERWHWSYLPLAKIFTKQFLQTVTYDDIKGFEGDGSAQKLEVIKKYVGGIAPECQ